MQKRATTWRSYGWTLLLCAALGLSGCGSSDNSSSDSGTPTTRTWLNVAYATASTAQVLDIYLPTTGNGPFPTIIWIHGGAFKFGDKANPQSLTTLNNAGYAVVSINYRLSGEAQWAAQLADLKSMITYLRAHSTEYALDTNKLGVWGASAGGHLAAMTGIALANDSATRVQAVVDWFGPMDFYNMDTDIIASGVTRCTTANGAADSPESALIGATVSTNKAKADAASPLSYLAALPASTNLPPFLIMHGLMDCNIAPKQSERLHTAIQTKFGTTKSSFMKLAAGTHGGGEFQEAYVETTVIDFLDTYLK